MRLRALLELLRVSLAPTVIADLGGGVALAGAVVDAPGLVFRVAPISLALFSGGMALNAWVDREEAIRPATALLLAIALLAAAPLLAAAITGPMARDCAIAAASIAALIALYHTPVKQHPVAGPLVLGAVRGSHLLLGAIAAAGIERAVEAAWPFAAAYAVYVAGAAVVAHHEDRAPNAGLVRGGVLLAFVAIGANGALAYRLAADNRQVALVAVTVTVWHLVSARGAALLLRGSLPPERGLAPFAAILLSRMPFIPAVAAFGASAGDLGLIAIVSFWLVIALVRVIPPT
jgi:4-hydroxybenzoate polyprenyltransferase